MKFVLPFAIVLSLQLAGAEGVSGQAYLEAWQAAMKNIDALRSAEPKKPTNLQELVNLSFQHAAKDDKATPLIKESVGNWQLPTAMDVVKARIAQLEKENPGGKIQRLVYKNSKNPALFYNYEGFDAEGVKRLLHVYVLVQEAAPGGLLIVTGDNIEHKQYLRMLEEARIAQAEIKDGL
jgi:hypothetical protein